jgi:hypothetical protein
MAMSLKARYAAPFAFRVVSTDATTARLSEHTKYAPGLFAANRKHGITRFGQPLRRSKPNSIFLTEATAEDVENGDCVYHMSSPDRELLFLTLQVLLPKSLHRLRQVNSSRGVTDPVFAQA